jgi:hypothetical protein
VRFTDARISEQTEAEVGQVASVLALLLDLIALPDVARSVLGRAMRCGGL